MQNSRLKHHQKLYHKKTIVFMLLTTILVIAYIFIHFFHFPKINEFNSQNKALNEQLQTLKKQNSELINENSKLKKDYTDIKNKVDSVSKVSQ